MKHYLIAILALVAIIPTAKAQNCTAAISSPILFAGVDPFASGTYDTTGNLTVTCSGFASGATIAVCPDLGSGSGGFNPSNQRLLARGGGPETLGFQIFQDASRTTPWGSVGSFGANSIPQLSRTGNGPIAATLYFRLYMNSGVSPPSTYSSSFNSTVRYGSVPSTAGGCGGTTLTGTTLAPFLVQTLIQPSCHLDISQHIDFGTVTRLASNTDTSGALSVQCTSGTNYKLAMSAGNGAGATTASRKMTAPNGATIIYALYQNSNRTLLWGNSPDIDTESGNGVGASLSIPVYGRIPPQANPAPGTYRDTIVVTLTY